MIVLIALVALVLGMGLPVTAAYIVLAVMAVPLLGEFGLSLLTAHLMVFWLSQTSNVTPPVALAAFAGAGVANARPVGSSVEAFKLAAGLFVIPVMMAYTALVYTGGDWLALMVAIVRTLAIILAIAIAVEGHLMRPLSMLERGLALGCVPLLLFDPYSTGILGIIGVLYVVIRQWRAVSRGSIRR